MTWNLGSVGSVALMRTDNVPSSLSGALPGIAETALNRVENYTGVSIGSDGITSQYQPAVLYFTLAELNNLMSIQGSDKSYSLGELSVKSVSAGEGPSEVAMKYEAMAEKELQRLGRKTTKYVRY